jgi:hypothetical protein
MVQRPVSFSDLSGEMAVEPDVLVPLEVTDYPDSEPGQRRRIEVTPGELTRIGEMAIGAVGLETLPTGEGARRTRLVVPIGDLATLATVGTIEEVLANAEPVTPPKPPKPQGRGNHNRRADGGDLVNYNDPDYSGLPHNGRIGGQEAAFVRANLELVNANRRDAGHPPINPEDPSDAKKYGFTTSDQATMPEPTQTSEPTPASDQESSLDQAEASEKGSEPEQDSTPGQDSAQDQGQTVEPASDPEEGAPSDELEGRRGRRRRS